MVGLWAFDEGNGKTAKDASGNKNHGILMGDTKWVNGKKDEGEASILFRQRAAI